MENANVQEKVSHLGSKPIHYASEDHERRSHGSIGNTVGSILGMNLYEYSISLSPVGEESKVISKIGIHAPINNNQKRMRKNINRSGNAEGEQ